jgi:outer membrane cobalamin receptor
MSIKGRKMPLRTLLRLLLLGIISMPVGVTRLPADTAVPVPAHNETMLMFVGENIKVLKIASRREQSAWQAPAIARVITQQEIREQGYRTLSDALETVPGFHMATKEWGTRPYLRGIPNSTLFLYDTVPVASEVNKAIHHIDHELPLWSTKRIEIINGPGSVLWGPDAFAGIVNVVPMTGKDLQGVETGALYGAPGDQRGFFVNAGHDGGLWDGFFTLSGRRGRQDTRPYSIVRFTGADGMPVPPDQRLGYGSPTMPNISTPTATLPTAAGSISRAAWPSTRNPYTMTSNEGATRWGESRSTPFGFVKVEAKRDLDWSSALKFTGYYAYLANEHEVIDRTHTQKENTAYAEIVYDRAVMQGTGMITGGLSYRQREIDNAPIWTGYLPGYLASENPAFMPIVLEKDFDSRLWSLFGQVMKTIGNVDLFAGARHDMHDDLADQTSVNAGIGWSPRAAWRYKLQYGTAYRTPFARQLYTSSDPDFEEIRSLNLQVAWQPSAHERFDHGIPPADRQPCHGRPLRRAVPAQPPGHLRHRVGRIHPAPQNPHAPDRLYLADQQRPG